MHGFDATAYSTTAFAAHLRAQLGPEVPEDKIHSIGEANLYHLELLARHQPQQRASRGLIFKAAGTELLESNAAPPSTAWLQPGMQGRLLPGDHFSVIKDATSLAIIAAELRRLSI